MAAPENDNLLARLAGAGPRSDGLDPYAAVAVREPDHDLDPEQDAGDPEADLMLDRINHMAAGPGDSPRSGEPPSPQPESAPGFVPVEPESFEAAGLTASEVEALILKFLLARGDAAGREIAEQVKLPFVLVDELLRQLKSDRLVGHRGSAPMNDYRYELSDVGRERAQRYSAYCTYFGSAPVSLEDYIASVHAQSLTNQHPTADCLRQAFGDLLLSRRMFDRLGPAINSGRGLFLFGPPGNGKTSIAERVTAAFGQHTWIPRAIAVDGEIIRLFDPVNHDEVPLEPGTGLIDRRKIDKRWVRVRRPTIITGGELTMTQLEVTMNTSTGISEAPLQLKSNCGTLVIDDFGRQRMRIDELLNRWIVPLEKRYDFLNLPNGKKIKVPFDQLIIFSTNLEPRELVDEAFLRRIPYKIEVTDPSEEEFHDLFELMCQKLGVEYSRPAVEHLIATHYRRDGRPLRFCQPRDLVLQIRNFCKYHNQPPQLTTEYLDRAVENYFAVM